MICFVLYCCNAIILSTHFYQHIPELCQISGLSDNSLKRKKKKRKMERSRFSQKSHSISSRIMFVVLYRNLLFFSLFISFSHVGSEKRFSH